MEILDVYDSNGHVTGRKVLRENKEEKFGEDEHIAVANIIIKNSKNEYLLEKKPESDGGKYSFVGGHVDSGEIPSQSIIRETLEEIGLDISNENVVSLGFILVDFPLRYSFYLEKDIDINTLKLQEEEVEKVVFKSADKIRKLYEEEKMRKFTYAFFTQSLIKLNKIKKEKNK